MTVHEKIRTWIQATGVLVAALALLGTAGYFAVSSVVAEETQDLRDRVLVMQHDITAMQHDMTALQHDMTALQHDMTALQHDMTALQRDMATMRNDIAALKIDNGKIKEAIAQNAVSLQELLRRLPPVSAPN